MRKMLSGIVLGVLFSVAAMGQAELAGAIQLFEQGKLAQAKSSFEAMVRKNPKQPEPHY